VNKTILKQKIFVPKIKYKSKHSREVYKKKWKIYIFKMIENNGQQLLSIKRNKKYDHDKNFNFDIR
jgi:hypothetical protein